VMTVKGSNIAEALFLLVTGLVGARFSKASGYQKQQENDDAPGREQINEDRFILGLLCYEQQRPAK